MKKNYIIFLVSAIISLLGFGIAQSNAEDLINQIINNQRGGQSGSSTISMQVIKPTKTTLFVIESLSDGNDKSLINVIEPSKDAGQAFLTVGDNLWIYNPRLKRTLRLPPSGRSDSFLGSDISYNDLGGRDLATDYQATILEETDSTVTLELIPDELAPTPYGRVLITADINTLAPLEQTFYDQRENAVRRISFDNFAELDSYFFPTYIKVENLLREGEQTVIEISNYDFGIDIPENCFQQQVLERGCQ